MNQPNHPNSGQANYQAAFHQAPAVMAPLAAPGYPPGYAHVAYYQGPPVMAPPARYPPEPPNRGSGFLNGCLAFFCCYLRNYNTDPTDVIGGDVCCCDCFGAGDICFNM